MSDSTEPAPRRRRLPRITTRRLMILVALVGVAIPAWLECRRLVELGRRYSGWAGMCLGDVKKYSSQVVALGREVARLEGQEAGSATPGGEQDDAGATDAIRRLQRKRLERMRREEDLARRRVEYFGMLARKYERAAWRPWLAVEPDPPPPFDPLGPP